MDELESLKKRVAELEAEVLKLRAGAGNHYHYHYQTQPAPVYQPQIPSVPSWPTVWCYGGATGAYIYQN